MYAKRIQLINYGPIDQLDISFPFDGDSPKPIVLVGENGSGKSICLSHIVNGLLAAQGVLFPHSPEVEAGKVYKLRSSFYIKTGKEFYFAKVDYEDDLHIGEFRSRYKKQSYEELPTGLLGTNFQVLWDEMEPEGNDNFTTCISSRNKDRIRRVYSRRCVLYFPPNRFEEPAWLNEGNLLARARVMEAKNLEGHTHRKVVNYSPLNEIQNWLFGVVYDRAVFEFQTSDISLPIDSGKETIVLPVFRGFSGNASRAFENSMSIVQAILRKRNVRFGIGGRHNRVVSIESSQGQVIPNVFQLSSGETSLLNLFLSILRDYELSGSVFSRTEDIRGIVVVDEIDLHLHAEHQYKVLPELIKMFPKVQFIVTTHSPLFVLGLRILLGEGGFGLFQLPDGQQISPEEFTEFGRAINSFSDTRRYSEHIRQAIEKSLKPIIFAEGKTDIKYIEKAAEHLEQLKVLDKIQLRDGQGFGGLNKVSKHFDTALSEITPQDIILLYDCDKPKMDSQGNVHKRHIPLQENNPVEEGIENLFSRETLLKAREFKREFIDVTSEHKEMIRGENRTIPEKWVINSDEKTNLCNWLCDNGTADDFQHFQGVFDLLEELLDLAKPS